MDDRIDEVKMTMFADRSWLLCVFLLLALLLDDRIDEVKRKKNECEASLRARRFLINWCENWLLYVFLFVP
jgi:hypothetical protein